MERIITDKDYPINNVWVLKLLTPALAATVVFGSIFAAFTYFNGGSNGESNIIILNLVLYFCILFFSVTSIIIHKFTFHYALNREYIEFQQGFLNRQVRHIPYGVIQNIYQKQDILDKFFGICSLTIENASVGAGAYSRKHPNIFIETSSSMEYRKRFEEIGFKGNRVSIPGLKKENADTLKNLILDKIRNNEIEDNQSGL